MLQHDWEHHPWTAKGRHLLGRNGQHPANAPRLGGMWAPFFLATHQSVRLGTFCACFILDSSLSDLVEFVRSKPCRLAYMGKRHMTAFFGVQSHALPQGVQLLVCRIIILCNKHITW